MKNMKKIIAALILLSGNLSLATRVAVTDSGTDFSHAVLKGHALINEKEIAGNMVDDDHNGKVDDIVGWNFVDDYNQVFFPEHLKSVPEKTFKFFEVLSRIQADNATEEDHIFWEENVKKLPPEQKKALAAQLNFYGEYAHSTHVSGIIAALSPQSKIMSNRVFPDTPPEENFTANFGGISSMLYKLLAALTNGTFLKVGNYLAERKIDVANYSLGSSLVNIAKMMLALKGNSNPTNEQLSAETKKVAAEYEPQGRKWMGASPNTLFVIAAGNDGQDNDVLPTFPANIHMPNSITVAASNGISSLASFSNYGIKNVDIAAPGVAIVSSVPSLNHQQLLPMSGTSMAAPYIAGVAARAKEINPKLTPADLKLMLMQTVDKKAWLKTKVVSEGVVNPSRLYFAADAAKRMSVVEAIKTARMKVVDAQEPHSLQKNIGIRATREMKNFARQIVF